MAMDGHTRISMSIDWYAPVVPHCARTYHTIDRTMCLVHRKYGLKMLIAHILGILSAFLALSLSPPSFSLPESLRHFHFAISRQHTLSL